MKKTRTFVSIPFKRESVFREERKRGAPESAWCQFQFPSNGKVYSERIETYNNETNVSTFQFPSNGKVYSEETVVPTEVENEL